MGTSQELTAFEKRTIVMMALMHREMSKAPPGTIEGLCPPAIEDSLSVVLSGYNILVDHTVWEELIQMTFGVNL